MDPGVVLVVLIVFAFVLAVVRMGLNADREKRRDKLSAQDNSLRLSELQTMIREAVAEANAPLEERIEALEAERRALPEARPDLLAEAEGFDIEPEPQPAAHQRVR